MILRLHWCTFMKASWKLIVMLKNEAIASQTLSRLYFMVNPNLTVLSYIHNSIHCEKVPDTTGCNAALNLQLAVDTHCRTWPALCSSDTHLPSLPLLFASSLLRQSVILYNSRHSQHSITHPQLAWLAHVMEYYVYFHFLWLINQRQLLLSRAGSIQYGNLFLCHLQVSFGKVYLRLFLFPFIKNGCLTVTFPLRHFCIRSLLSYRHNF